MTKINQETKEIKTSVFLIHRVAVTITTRSFASGRGNIFMHLHVLSKHFDTHKITEKSECVLLGLGVMI